MGSEERGGDCLPTSLFALRYSLLARSWRVATPFAEAPRTTKFPCNGAHLSGHAALRRRRVSPGGSDRQKGARCRRYSKRCCNALPDLRSGPTPRAVPMPACTPAEWLSAARCRRAGPPMPSNGHSTRSCRKIAGPKRCGRCTRGFTHACPPPVGSTAISSAPIPALPRPSAGATSGPWDGHWIATVSTSRPIRSWVSTISTPSASGALRVPTNAVAFVRPGGRPGPRAQGVVFDIAADRLPSPHGPNAGGHDGGHRPRTPRLSDMDRLLALDASVTTSPPAPARGLYFVAAEYPEQCFA